MTAQAINKMKVRNIKFNFDDVRDRHYVANNIFATHFSNALHVVFPEGEKMFIKSVKAFFKEIKDPELRKEMVDFMHQEGVHQREHARFWKNLDQMGLKPRGLVKAVGQVFKTVEKGADLLLSERNKNKLMLSMTVGMEHYTALFGNQNLGNPEFFKRSQPESMQMLGLWHSAEELEHKAVAFDVLDKIDDSYSLRIIGMLLASGLFYTLAFGGTAYFIAQDPRKNTSNLIQKLMEFGENFAAKPTGAEGWKLLLDYFKPNFHPNDHDNYDLAHDFFDENKEYFEALTAHYTKTEKDD